MGNDQKNDVVFNFGNVTVTKKLTYKELEKEKKELIKQKIMFSYSVTKAVKLDSVEKSEIKKEENAK